MTGSQFHHPKLGYVLDGAGLKDAHVQGLKCSGDSISTPCLCSFLSFGFIHFIDRGISPQGKGQGPGCPGPNALGWLMTLKEGEFFSLLDVVENFQERSWFELRDYIWINLREQGNGRL